jgi:hypothetical protein
MSYEVSRDEIKEGTNVAFPQDGCISPFLSTILSWFEPDWKNVNPKFWHVGFIVHKDTIESAIKRNYLVEDFVAPDPNDDEWWVCESITNGVSLTPLSKYDDTELRFFNIIQNQPTRSKVADYLAFFVGRPYDGLVYVWTVAAELLEKVRIHLGNWNNLSFTCWENLEAFMDFIGEGMVKDYDHIMCTDFARAWGLV